MSETVGMAEGFGIICQQAKVISLFPIEEWLGALDIAESIAPILDPTLYRRYIYSEKPDVLKKILRAALALKIAMAEAQPAVLREIEKEQASKESR
jgi:hypothetical protein